MKALTLWRPWTTLVLQHGKDIENRPWSTRYRGTLIIHGGKEFDRTCVIDAALDHDIWLSENPQAHPTGLLGTVDVVGVCGLAVEAGNTLVDVPCRCGKWAQPGKYHWKLAKPRLLHEPIPARGFQTLWDPWPESVDRVQAQLREARRDVQA